MTYPGELFQALGRLFQAVLAYFEKVTSEHWDLTTPDEIKYRSIPVPG